MDAFVNFAKTTVSTGYAAADVSIDLQAGDAARLPVAPFNATWWNSTDYADPSDDPDREIIRVTAIAADTLTITRAQEGTVATDKNIAAKTYKLIAGLTAKTLIELPSLSAGLEFYKQTGVLPVDRWYLAGQSGTASLLTGAMTLNVIRAYPVCLSRGGTIDMVGIQVTTPAAAGGVARLAFYDATSETDLTPLNLVLDCGEVATDVGGMRTLAISLPLVPGKLYWLAINCGVAAPTVRVLSAPMLYPILGVDNIFGTATTGVGWTCAFAYAAFPALFPAATVQTGAAGALGYHIA